MNIVMSRAEAKAKGLKVYYTGKPCKHGHMAERRVSNGKCVECVKQYNAQYHQSNAESRQRYNKQYYQDNVDYYKQHNKQWRKDNAEACSEYEKRYFRENAERIKQVKKQYKTQWYQNRGAEIKRNAYWHERQKLADSLGVELKYLSMGGYQPSRRGTFYIVKIKIGWRLCLGFGITNNLKQRMQQHRCYCKKAGATLELLETFEDEDGYVIAEMERNVKESVQIYDTGIEGFKTEACIYSDENLQMIRDNMYYCETKLQAA